MQNQKLTPQDSSYPSVGSANNCGAIGTSTTRPIGTSSATPDRSTIRVGGMFPYHRRSIRTGTTCPIDTIGTRNSMGWSSDGKPAEQNHDCKRNASHDKPRFRDWDQPIPVDFGLQAQMTEIARRVRLSQSAVVPSAVLLLSCKDSSRAVQCTNRASLSMHASLLPSIFSTRQVGPLRGSKTRSEREGRVAA
jgi:hypothetical protein